MHTAVWNYIAFFVAATAIGLIGMRELRRRARGERESFERAVPGLARVLKVGNATPSRAYGAIIVDLLIQVHRPGVQPYEASMIWSVEPGSLPRVQVGQTFAIRVDPVSPHKIYSGEKWAHSLGEKTSPFE